MGILLGYSEVGYRVILGGKIIVVRYVEVIKTDTNVSVLRRIHSMQIAMIIKIIIY